MKVFKVLSVMCLLIYLVNPSLGQSSVPTEVPVATEEVVVTPEVIVSDPVTVIVQTDTPAPVSTDKDWLNLRQIVELIGGMALIAVAIFRGGDLLTGIGELVSKVTGSKLITDGAMAQYRSLSPDLQNKIATLIQVVDPLTKTTINDVDDRIVIWLHTVTAPVDGMVKPESIGSEQTAPLE